MQHVNCALYLVSLVVNVTSAVAAHRANQDHVPLLALETIHGAHRHLQPGQGLALEQLSDEGRLVVG